MTTLARIERTPLIGLNGRDRIVSATMFAALRTRGICLGGGQWLASITGGAPERPPVRTPPGMLARVAGRLTHRLLHLEAVLDTEETAWPPYVATAAALAAILAQIRREGSLLTTAEMAERLGIKPKTLLKHKKRGTVRPALQEGKLIRWRGDEAKR
jgi:hypothetical protein